MTTIKISKEMISEAKKLMKIYNMISVSYLQMKMKISAQAAAMIIKLINTEKIPKDNTLL